jgi:hypothetical protein
MSDHKNKTQGRKVWNANVRYWGPMHDVVSVAAEDADKAKVMVEHLMKDMQQVEIVEVYDIEDVPHFMKSIPAEAFEEMIQASDQLELELDAEESEKEEQETVH